MTTEIRRKVSESELHALVSALPDLLSDMHSGVHYDAVTREIVYPPAAQERIEAVDLSRESIDSLIAYAAQKRWHVEVGGCPWGEHVIQTDRDSRANLIAEFVAIAAGLRADPSPWKMRGGFVSLSNAEMGQAVMAARTHVAAAFAVEQQVVAAIMAGTITRRSEIDGAKWPG